MKTRKFWLVWGVLLIAAVLTSIAAAKLAYFPGDVALAGFIQSLTGDRVDWARTITSTVSPPYSYMLIAVSALLSWRLAGWRAALLALISFGGLWLAEPYLKSMVGRPRPDPSLIRVFGSPSGFSYPSGFALIFFSTIGWLAVLAYQKLRGQSRTILVYACVLLLLVGGWARVALGAHWPSDIWGAYLIGLVWTMPLAGLVFSGKKLSAAS